MGYLGDHVSIANSLEKPIVLEEFGAARDGGAFEIEAGTEIRDEYYVMIYEALQKLAAEGNAVGGSNVWSWAGVGRPVTPGEAWQEGEAFTGDPPHEKQGWYSIYDTDSTTIDVVRRYAQSMDALRSPIAPSDSTESSSTMRDEHVEEN
jgi:mannan endo-1,4-beta-mannosidase